MTEDKTIVDLRKEFSQLAEFVKSNTNKKGDSFKITDSDLVDEIKKNFQEFSLMAFINELNLIQKNGSFILVRRSTPLRIITLE